MQSLVHLVFAYATICGLVGSGIQAATLPTATGALSEQLQQEFATSTSTTAAAAAAAAVAAPAAATATRSTATLGTAAVLDGEVAVAAIAPTTLGSNIDSDSLEFSAISAKTEVDVAPCSLSSPELNECIRNQFLTIAPKLKITGLPQYNMISVDPYFYKRGIFRYANDGIQGGLLIKNMNIYGISDLKVNSVLSNFTENGFIIKLGAELAQLRADGQFKADVKFGGLRLVPKGPFNITVDDIKATILTDGTVDRTESGGQRVRLNRLNANVNIGAAKIVANGIFSDRNLNAMILNLVNENLPEITRVGIPATREQWAPILVAHINEFFAQVPIEKFLVQ